MSRNPDLSDRYDLGAPWLPLRSLHNALDNFSISPLPYENIFLDVFGAPMLLNLDHRYIRAGSALIFRSCRRLALPLPPPNMLNPVVALIALAAVAAGESSSSSSSQARTTVWMTGTNALGVTVVTQGIYTPTFRESPVFVSHVSEGLVGMGSLSGTVGKIRDYSTKTVNDGISLKASGSFAIICALLVL